MDKNFIGKLLHHTMIILTLFVGLIMNLSYAQVQEAIEMYAKKEWFTRHPSSLVSLEGEIRKIDNPLGPNTRGSWYVFQNDNDTLSIYDPENLIKKDFVKGRKLIISGKIVDLENEGFSKEIWIGYIKN
jgi:hypothetical protein